MPDLLIRIKKKNDGSAALSCTRSDGSVTWQRQDGQQGQFFPLHDLTHYAVESTLGFRRAFYGLLAEGWDIGVFEAPGQAARMPDDAFLAELIVGLLDVERATGERADAVDFNWKLAAYHDEHGLGAPSFRITDDQLNEIRRVRAAVFERWRAVPEGAALELTFDRDAP